MLQDGARMREFCRAVGKIQAPKVSRFFTGVASKRQEI